MGFRVSSISITTFLLSIVLVHGRWEQAFFRGTPNNFQSTAMTRRSGDGFWTTTQTFGTDNPRFKIDRFGDWSQSVPPLDFLINQGPGQYIITFDDSSGNVITRIRAVKVGGPRVVNIQIQCDNGETRPGESIYVEGDNPEFGSTPILSPRGDSSRTWPSWRRVFTITFNRVVRWRCIWRPENDPGRILRATPYKTSTATVDDTWFNNFNNS